MKEESINSIKQMLIKRYRKIGDDNALLFKCGGKSSWTGNELADEIENETQFGIDRINSILQLTIDLLKRDKLNAE